MYNIGDKLVYPMHGAGIVEAIEEKEVLDEIRSYYIMRIPMGDVKVMVPVANSEKVGIRDVIDEARADEVINAFRGFKADVQSNWNKRYRENMDKIRTGDIVDVSYVVKTLMLKEKMKGLSMGEKKMLSSTQKILMSELMIAKDMTFVEIENKLTSIVRADLITLGIAVPAEIAADEAVTTPITIKVPASEVADEAAASITVVEPETAKADEELVEA